MQPSTVLGLGTLFVAAFYLAMAETALCEYAETKLDEMLGDRQRRARFRGYLERCALMRSGAALFGGLACVVLAIAIANRFDNPLGVGALGCAVVIAFLLGRMLPRSIGRRWPEHILLTALPVLYGMSWPILPFAAIGRAARERVVGTDHADERKANLEDFEHEVLSVVSEGQKEGVIGHQAKQMIEGIFDLRDADVAEIMTPRTAMMAVSADSSPEEARKLAVEDGHSRYPVFDGNVDNVIGVLYVKDLLLHLSEQGWDDTSVRDLMREPTYVPETKRIAELLRELRRSRVHIVIVLDEYGGTAGIATIEDIIEEIVGEIEDEYDLANGVMLKRIDADTLEVDARVHIDDLNDALEIHLPEEDDFDTVGGFVFASMGRVPAIGESCVVQDVEFTVLEADPRRISRVRVKILRDQE